MNALAVHQLKKTDANIEEVREAVDKDRRQSIQDIASAVGISYGSCQSILTENLNPS
jgi:uncharacterized protein YdbL (DUF1318 family)